MGQGIVDPDSLKTQLEALLESHEIPLPIDWDRYFEGNGSKVLRFYDPRLVPASFEPNKNEFRGR